MNITALPLEIIAIIAWKARESVHSIALTCTKFATAVRTIPRAKLQLSKVLKEMPRIYYVLDSSREHIRVLIKENMVKLLCLMDEKYRPFEWSVIVMKQPYTIGIINYYKGHKYLCSGAIQRDKIVQIFKMLRIKPKGLVLKA